MAGGRTRRRPTVTGWLATAVAAAGIAVPLWVAVTAWGAVVHGHPLYAVLLAITLVASALVLASRLRTPGRPPRRRLRTVAAVVGLVVAAACVAALGWLRPSTAVEPALAAMRSGGGVAVQESATRVVMEPTGAVSGTGVLFQPGARVEARAYAAVLRPLAEAGHPVVIVKQPLGIAFTATGAFGKAREDQPQVERWVVGGHSLGGVVAAIDADAHADDRTGPVVGLMLYASYPASDLSTLDAAVLSVSGSRDGLATPAAVEASRTDLPPGTTYRRVQGGVHAFFGDYGPQAGDGTPTVSHAAARAEISRASVAFVDALGS